MGSRMRSVSKSCSLWEDIWNYFAKNNLRKFLRGGVKRQGPVWWTAWFKEGLGISPNPSVCCLVSCLVRRCCFLFLLWQLRMFCFNHHPGSIFTFFLLSLTVTTAHLEPMNPRTGILCASIIAIGPKGLSIPRFLFISMYFLSCTRLTDSTIM